VTGAFLKLLTRARVGAGLSIVLIVFGVIDATVPQHPGFPQHTGGLGSAAAAPRLQRGARDAVAASPETAAQDVAERFVIATDTTDPAHPGGDVVTESTLAPELTSPHDMSWPVAWTKEERCTTVALDPPGPPLAESSGQVVVILTGVMTVTTDSSPPTAVPLVDRVTLRLVSDGPLSDRGVSGDAVHGGRRSIRWVVTSVEVGS
jgi:hypothetical protein